MRPSLIALLVVSGSLHAQQPAPPPIRPIGVIEHVTSDSLAAVTTAVQTSGGRVFVNDIVARRVLLYDSTLANPKIVADSTGATATAYGPQLGTLLSYHGDSALFISPASLSMLVLSPTGDIKRTMAMPPSTTPGLFFGNVGFDSQGRMLYVVQVRGANSYSVRSGETGPWYMTAPDSSFLVRFDLGVRKLDTVGILRSSRNKAVITRNEQGGTTFTQTIYPIQVVDDWTVMRDGTLAMIRGRDYHVDWFGPDGQWSATPKVLFEWERLDDAQKRTLIDSAVTRTQFFIDSLSEARTAADAASGSGAARGGRGGTGSPMFRQIYVGADLTDVPDYRPAIRQSATRADADGNLWVRTTLIVDKRVVYDVVNRKGELIDRVQLPRNRGLAGFGPGVNYMSVLDSLKVAHLERARIK